MDIKFKLTTYYSDLLKQISEYSSEKVKEYKKIICKDKNISELFEYIKHLTSLLIELKISNFSSNYKKNDYIKLENYTKKLETDIKKLYKQIFEYKIQTTALEDKIKVYKIIQQDYEELKEKVKYFGGKFLDNERKENEILILRQENETIKKELAKFNKKNQLNETLKNNYITKINEMNEEIAKLNKKLESKLNISSCINNYNSSNASSANINITNQDNNLLSKLLYKPDIIEMKNIISNKIINKKHYKFLTGLKHIIQKTTFNNTKRQSNHNITKNLYLNSNNNLKSNFNCSTVSTSVQNIFTSNYNKINSHDKIKKNKKRKNQRNINSISMKIEKEQNNKSFSLNKYIRNGNHNRHINKSDNNNKKSNSKINNPKPNENCPMSCKNKGSSRVRKILKKNLGINNYNTFYDSNIRFKKCNSTLNIKIVPK